MNFLSRISTRWSDIFCALVALVVTALTYHYVLPNPQAGFSLADNTLLTISMITYEGLRVLMNQLGFSARVNREYDPAFAVKGAKIGDTLNIRKPPRYVGRTGNAIRVEATTETSVPLVLDTLFGVDVEFGSLERTLSLDAYSERVLKPKMATIGNKIDLDGLLLYKKVFNAVGTPGTVPSSFSTYIDAGVKLDDEACPQDDLRYMGISPRMQGTIVNAAIALFNPQGQISQSYKKGRMGEFDNFEFFMTQNAPTHTVGTYAGTPLVNGANQTGSSLITDGWSSGASTLKEGDIFTIDNVYAVNPQNRLSTGQLRQFVVTQDISDTTGAMTIPIYPPIVASGQFQTVDSVPADNAAITVHGTTGRVHRVGLAFHRDFCTLGTADQELPQGVHEAAYIQDPESGLSVRTVTAYDVNTNKMVTRTECLYGWAPLYRELACRVSS